jgi:hypothetical protein
MPMPAQKPATTPIPVQLSESDFNPFILPHLRMPRRGPKEVVTSFSNGAKVLPYLKIVSLRDQQSHLQIRPFHHAHAGTKTSNHADCKILQQDGLLSATLPQRFERLQGGEVVYHDLVEFADPTTWSAIAPRLVAYYQTASKGAHESVAAAPAPPKRERKTAPKPSAPKTIAGQKRSNA